VEVIDSTQRALQTVENGVHLPA